MRHSRCPPAAAAITPLADTSAITASDVATMAHGQVGGATQRRHDHEAAPTPSRPDRKPAVTPVPPSARAQGAVQRKRPVSALSRQGGQCAP